MTAGPTRADFTSHARNRPDQPAPTETDHPPDARRNGAPGYGSAPIAERIPRYTTRHEVESLGVSLGPALHEACLDRLGDIEWFQSPWQKSGAATGYTTWRLPDGSVVDAIAKVPVGYREYFWSTRLGEVDPMWWRSETCRHLPVPRVLASGTTLGGYDVAWLVVERVSGKPISHELSHETLDRLFAAAAKFHRMAQEVMPVGEGKPRPDLEWEKLLDRGAEAAEDNMIDEYRAWQAAIASVRRILPDLVERWNARPMDTWCHGDLHPGNVLTRCDETCPDDRCGVLIDLALVHPGHWVEDALYIERLHWGREHLLRGVEPMEALAHHRRRQGLQADETDLELANIRRILMAATSPAFLSQENDGVYLAGALARLRKILPK